MSQQMRFGRKLAVPSTRQIIHELRVMALQDELRRLEQLQPGSNPSQPTQPAEPQRELA